MTFCKYKHWPEYTIHHEYMLYGKTQIVEAKNK